MSTADLRSNGWPQVVVVEDDPALRLFVSMALEHFEINLVLCANAPEARAALQAPTSLLMCDLQLPGESGMSLLKDLSAKRPSAPRTIVFSGGLDDEVHRRLDELGVWRAIAKPCSLATLEGAVRDALAACSQGAVAEPSIEAPAHQPQAPSVGARQDAAVQEHFEGDQALYLEYADFCMAQFPQDIRDGNLAAETGNVQALRRMGHSLKTVLRTLGYSELAEVAAQLEARALAGEPAPALADWRDLAGGLTHLVTAGA